MSDKEGPVSHPRPPRPVPFGSMKSASDTVLTEPLPRKESMGELSIDSRGALRSELSKRRMSLTPQECVFLEELIEHGKEVEVTVAHKTLCDNDLFFDNGWSDGVSSGTDLHPMSDPGQGQASLSSDDMERILRFSETLGSSATVGSYKRQQHLDQRRKSVLFGKLWKAHEHGIPLRGTRQRSKSIACLREGNSIVVRRSSFLSTETANLLENGGPLVREGEDAIFRRTGEDAVFRKPLSSKGRLMNRSRRISWDRAAAAAWAKPRRPTLRRLASDGSRKSVSFAEYDDENGDHPTRLPGIPRRITRKREVSSDSVVSALETDLDDDSSIPSLHHPTPVRSESVTSIHSIHHAHPIRSDSVSSIPSLHHPTPVRSDSVASIHSIHHAHRIGSDPYLAKDVDASMSDVSIPSLHHGHPIQDESLASFQSSRSPTEKERRDPAWLDPLVKSEAAQKTQLLHHPSQQHQRPVLMRRASSNVYNGEGIEVEELPAEIDAFEVDSIGKARKYRSMLSFGETATNGSVLSSSSFDQSMNRDSIFRDLRRSLSDEGRSNFFLGGASSPLSMGTSAVSISTLRPEEDDASWDMENDSPTKGHYDAWDVLVEDPSYGAGDVTALPFRVLGTSADDEASTPHVLSPPLMDSLRNFFPYSLSDTNFWMRYSLLRDGCSLHSLLQKIRGAKYTIIAIETVDGEVFGSFTSEPWRKNWKYFGTGESFLWRMRQSRKTLCFDVFDQAKLESELDVYPWTGDNDCVQLCTHEKLAVGGGATSDEKKNDDSSTTEYGFGLAIEKDLLYGTSTSCATFSSPPMSLEHSDGSPFEIFNLEVWALTPCSTVEKAEKLELGQLFLRTNTK